MKGKSEQYFYADLLKVKQTLCYFGEERSKENKKLNIIKL